MFEDGDKALNAIGVALAVVAVGGLLLVGALIVNPPEDTGAPQPTADWELERINGSHARIVHAGGEPVPAERLLVTVDGNRRDVTATGQLTEGEGFVVPASEGALVQLFWTSENAGPEPLATWRR